MTTIDKIRAEIERLYYNEAEKDESILAADAYKNALDAVEKFLDTLEEPISEYLEEEVKRYYSDNFAYISGDAPTLSILTNIASHFAEWQKAKMMEGAVEGEVVKDISNKLAVTAKNINLDGFKFGDKVRIIILPKEDGE